MQDDTYRDISYCGLYCPLCADRNRIPPQARALQDTLKEEGWESFGNYVFPEFDAFWRVLSQLTDPQRVCPGCRAGGGPPTCRIRHCAQDRGVRVCVECSDYPCEHIQQLSHIYPRLIPDGRRLAACGIERWVEEQEKRRTRGFAYSDTRYPRADDPPW